MFEGLTLKEFIILIVFIAAAVSIIVGLVKSSLRVVVSVVICVVLFSGFTWLPEKIKTWTGSDVEPGDLNATINTVKNEAADFFDVDEEKIDEGIEKTKNAVNSTKDFVKNESPSWIDAAKSLWAKISGSNEEETNSEVENTVE